MVFVGILLMILQLNAFNENVAPDGMFSNRIITEETGASLKIFHHLCFGQAFEETCSGEDSETALREYLDW